MRTLRLTSKLSQKIAVFPKKSLPLEDNPLCDWTARLLTAKRVQYIVITNTSFLYSCIMKGRGITDEASFVRQVDRSIKEQMRNDGLIFHYERFLAPHIGETVFSKALNQSVTGSMNDIVQHIKFYIEGWGLPLAEVSNRILNLPMKSLGYECPITVLRQMKR